MSLFSSERIEENRRGSNKIASLKLKKDKTMVIHYSCESFFNLQGRTPRITSIVVKNRGNNITKSFSIHLQAQIHKKNLALLFDIDYDILEKAMLKDFYKFIKNHKTYNWVHWNMRNASYGFEAIFNRAQILKVTPSEIEDDFKFDFSDILGSIYTYGFEADKPFGKMLNLAKRNSVSERDALNGKGEADAFEKKEYLMLHMSTMRKVEIIDRILSLEESGQLKVNVSIREKYGLSPVGIIEIVKNNDFLLIIWSIVVFIAGAALEPIIQRLFHTV